MKHIKGAMAILLACVLALGLLPGGLGDFFVTEARADWEGGSISQADYEGNTVFRIKTADDWDALARFSQTSTSINFVGKTISLDSDIEFTSVAIAPIENFQGRFLGNRHKMTLPANASFTIRRIYTGFSGLFQKVTGTGNISGLIVELKGDLWSSDDMKANFKLNESFLPKGGAVIAGLLEGTASVKQCAVVVAPGASAVFHHYRGGHKDDISGGLIVAEMNSPTVSVDECYTNVNMRVAVTCVDNTYMYVGGIVGYMKGGSVTNSVAAGMWIDYYHPHPLKDGYQRSGCGGIVGRTTAGRVSNNRFNGNLYMFDLDENSGGTTSSSIRGSYSTGNAGGVAGWNTQGKADISGNYGNVAIINRDAASYSTLLNGVALDSSSASRLTSPLVDAASGVKMPQWMLEYSDASITFEGTTSDELVVNIDPPFLDLDMNGKEENQNPPPTYTYTYGAGDEQWYAYATIPLMGKQPTPEGMTTGAGGGSQTVSSITVGGPASGDTLYGGVSYEFQATVNGVNLDDFLAANPVSFQYEYLDSGNTVVGSETGNATDTLAIPATLPTDAKKLRVTPVCAAFASACQPQVYDLSQGEIAISIADGQEALQGTQVQMQAALTGSGDFVGQTVAWSVNGASTIDTNGLLTIAQTDTGPLTVEAVAGGITKTYSVDIVTQTFELAPETPSSSGSLTATPSVGIELSIPNNEDATWSQISGSGALGHTDQRPKNTYTPASGDTSAAVKATDISLKEATFNITVRQTAAKTATNTTITGNTRSGAVVEINSVATGTVGKITGDLDYEYITSPTAIANPAAASWLSYNDGGIPLDETSAKYVYIRTVEDDVNNASDYLTYEFTGGTWQSTGIPTNDGQAGAKRTTTPQLVPHTTAGADTAGQVKFDTSDAAADTVTITVYPWNPRYGPRTDGSSSSAFFRITKDKHTIGGASDTPEISLNTDTSQGYGVLITGKYSDTQIYYTTAVNGDTPEIPTISPTTLYTGMIPFPPTADEFEVWAIAVDGANKPSQVATATFRKDSLAKAIAPELRMGEDWLYYDSSAWYEPGTPVHFYHDQFDINDAGPNAAYVIRYTTEDGRTPTLNSGNSYDPTKPFKLPGNKDSVTVRAVLIDTANRLVSDVLEVRIRIRQKLPAPEPVAYGGVSYTVPTRPGGEVYLNFSSEAVSLLNSTGYSFSLVTYSAGVDGGLNVAAGPQPIEGMTYLSYSVSEGDSVTLPQIRYQTGAGDVSTAGIAYTYGVRKLTVSTESTDPTDPDAQVTTTTVSYINPTPIALTGEPRSTFTLSVMALSSADTYSDSEPKSYVYSFRDAVTALTSYPRTSADNPTAVQTGDIIELHSSASALIYYSVGNTQPKVEFINGSWVAQDSNTVLYDPNSPIVVSGSSRLIYSINAIAVDPSDALEASRASFQYQLPSPVQAVTVNPAEGKVVKGTKVTMYCATEGATIYYTTNGDTPEPYNSNVYDKNNPPVIEKKTTVTVMAELNGVTSQINSYEYTLSSQMSEPTSSLPTGYVVSKGSRILLSGGGTIAYTTDGKDPRSILEGDTSNSSSSSSTEGNNVYYGNTVVLDGDYGESVTIRAYCYRSGYTPSETVSFTYTIAERDDYLVANPVSGSVVKPGSTVQLSTSVTDGKIFYTIGDALPAVNNTYSTTFINTYDDDLGSEYDSYQWVAAEGTTLGSTIQVTGQPGETFTIRAIAVTDGAEGGTPRVFNYRINERSDAPTASIPSGAITFNGAATSLSAREGAAIYYTTDGTDPTTSSYLYKDPVRLESSIILKAMAVEPGKEPSEIVEYTYTQAGYTAAVTMSVTGGEVAQGTEVAMHTLTEGATIYYTTNGTEPTTDSQVYTSPIVIMRPVTIKATAYLQGLHTSPVNTTSFTVFEPLPEETEDENDANRWLDQTDRLTSRRTYDEYVGPTYTDVIIYNYEAGALLAAEEGAVEKDTDLIVREVATTPMDRSAVRAEMDYNIAQLYDIYLERGGERVQPAGTVEVGLPIPAENRNGIVVVVCLGDDGTLEAFPTRRSDNMAYFMTSHFSKYAIVIPETQRDSARSMLLVGLLSGLGTLLAAGAVFLALRRRRRRREEDEAAQKPTE